MGVAFFDLDKTLIAKNSAHMWVASERRLGFISRWQAVRAAWWLLKYSLGGADVTEAMRESIASMGGTPEVDLRERALTFFEAHVRPLYRPGGLRAIGEHRDRGDRVVLLTSSSPYLARPVYDDLALDHYLCTRLAVGDDGLFTGEPVEPLCFGAGKVELAQRYAAEIDVRLEQCSFYSDSTSDLPMLEAVGHPVVVHPDPRLRRIATGRGWPIAEWGVPQTGSSAPVSAE